MTADHLQAVFWSLTYILLIAYGIKYKTHGIPLIAICLNFAWETVALGAAFYVRSFSVAMLIRGAWFLLDCVIVFLYYFHETKFTENRMEKIRFAWAFFGSAICLVVLFLYGYMLISSFVIDLIMAVAFLHYVLHKKIQTGWMEYAIGITKLLGDLFAWTYYRRVLVVDRIGMCVLVCNICYLIIIIIKNARMKKAV